MAHHPNRPHHHQEKKKDKKKDRQKNKPPRKGLHQDWRTWTAVILMLVAITAYVLTNNESLGPEGEQEEAIGAVGE